MSKQKTAIRATYFSIATNVLLAVLKWITGYFGNSYALIADAIESTTDVFASSMVMLGLKYSSKPADENHPYGHGRAEPLVTFLVVAILVISAGLIAYNSIRNVGVSHEPPEAYTLYVLAAIIAWKEISYRWVMRKSRQTGSMALKAEAWHHRSDAITSVAAFAGISFALIAGPGYESADDIAALFASVIILYNAYLIFRPALGEIMDENLYEDLIARIRKIAMEMDSIITTEKCLIRKTGMSYYVDLHIIVDAELSVRKGHDIAHRLKDKLQSEIPELKDVLIHVEPNEE